MGSLTLKRLFHAAFVYHSEIMALELEEQSSNISPKACFVTTPVLAKIIQNMKQKEDSLSFQWDIVEIHLSNNYLTLSKKVPIFLFCYLIMIRAFIL
jgi:hypothetical protein